MTGARCSSVYPRAIRLSKFRARRLLLTGNRCVGIREAELPERSSGTWNTVDSSRQFQRSWRCSTRRVARTPLGDLPSAIAGAAFRTAEKSGAAIRAMSADRRKSDEM
jgi:hypothetical protein